MELLGKVGRRPIYYLAIRNNRAWRKSLPNGEWVVFTIANEEDEEMIYPVAKACIDHKVGAICSAGELAYRTEQAFDDEIVWRNLDKHDSSIKDEDMPVTTASNNFDEEFLLATTEMGAYQSSPLLVCIDMTKKKVRSYLQALIPKINAGWLPSEEEHLSPKYDAES